MSAPALGPGMSLPAVGVSPGQGEGSVHLVEDPNLLSSGRPAPEVLALRSDWWPPGAPLPHGVEAVLLDAIPADFGSGVPIPVLGRVDRDVLREGDWVEVNGTLARFQIEGVDEVQVVTSILERPDGRILLLERSSKVGSFRGRWAGVSGYIEAPTALEQAYREIVEETGLRANDLELVREGAPVLARDGTRVFVVHPYRFSVHRTDIQLDWEHTRAEWVDPTEILRRPTVPKLDRVWESLGGPLPKG
jgi:8-oxo-dGTP pyrophosphatase MutT (NUDIX family)